jgi:5'(3')-deoxyribonucleotidase
MSMLPEVLLDIDGVAANFIEGCRPAAERLIGRPVHHDEIDQWLIEKALGLDEAQTKELYRHVMEEGWCRSLPAYEHAKESVARIREFATVIPVTAHFFDSKTWAWERDEWILAHLEIPKTDIVHTHRKFQIDGDVLIDDKPEHLRRWHARHPHGRALLFQRNYNRNDGWTGPVVEDWPHLVGSLETYFLSQR